MPIKVLQLAKFAVLLVDKSAEEEYYDGGKGGGIHVPQPPAVFPIFGKVSIDHLNV